MKNKQPEPQAQFRGETITLSEFKYSVKFINEQLMKYAAQFGYESGEYKTAYRTVEQKMGIGMYPELDDFVITKGASHTLSEKDSVLKNVLESRNGGYIAKGAETSGVFLLDTQGAIPTLDDIESMYMREHPGKKPTPNALRRFAAIRDAVQSYLSVNAAWAFSEGAVIFGPEDVDAVKKRIRKKRAKEGRKFTYEEMYSMIAEAEGLNKAKWKQTTQEMSMMIPMSEKKNSSDITSRISVITDGDRSTSKDFIFSSEVERESKRRKEYRVENGEIVRVPFSYGPNR